MLSTSCAAVLESTEATGRFSVWLRSTHHSWTSEKWFPIPWVFVTFLDTFSRLSKRLWWLNSEVSTTRVALEKIDTWTSMTMCLRSMRVITLSWRSCRTFSQELTLRGGSSRGSCVALEKLVNHTLYRISVRKISCLLTSSVKTLRTILCKWLT